VGWALPLCAIELLDAPWPAVQTRCNRTDRTRQINGQLLRGAVAVSATADKDLLKPAALASRAFIK
jgi:hypothetical protein